MTNEVRNNIIREQSNENKLSRGEPQGACLRLNGFNHVKAGQ
jgi:hypothetical protein